MSDLGGVIRAWLSKDMSATATIQELLDFLNNAPAPDPDDVVGLWHFSSVVEQDGRFFVLAGDQVQLVADTEAEVRAHLAGCALATSYVLHRYSEGKIDLTQ